MLHTLVDNRDRPLLHWTPNTTDQHLTASIMDIVDRLALLSSRKLEWSHPSGGRHKKRSGFSRFHLPHSPCARHHAAPD